jgi:hypothetical protein
MHKFQDTTFVLISLASAPRGLFSIFLSNSYFRVNFDQGPSANYMAISLIFFIEPSANFLSFGSFDLSWTQLFLRFNWIEFELKKWFMMNLSLSFWQKQFLSSWAELNQLSSTLLHSFHF